MIIVAPVVRGNDMYEPLRVRPDYWDASVSVMHVNSDPVVALLSPDTVRGDEIALHCRTNEFSVLPPDFSDPSGEMDPMDSGWLAICPQDTRISISDERWCDEMLCQLSFSSPGYLCERAGLEGTESLAGDCL